MPALELAAGATHGAHRPDAVGCFVVDRLAPLERGLLEDAVDELCRLLREGSPGAHISAVTLAAPA